MKKIFLLGALSMITVMGRAQRFFYVESGNSAAKSVQEDLLKYSQFISKSAAQSDYIVRTSVDFKTEPRTATLSIVVEDSVTARPVYQASEDYRFAISKTDLQLSVYMAVRTFLARNIPGIIFYAKNDHQQGLSNGQF